MIITGIIMMGIGLIGLGVGMVAFNAAFHDRQRASRSHVAAMDAKRLADEYRSAGRVMFKNALDSYKEGQEFWQAATVALLDAKRREAKAEKMLEQFMVQKNLRVLDRKEAV